ncbi:Nuclear pore membrane glycoprotein 210 [Eumeta japonica]|uniref:Nuclear pore membrane glycoprotein 210 n=1 Tax=Eumeta variegata TaxID=151549 RepID=A0A4C2A125_EUMVA|nr:Nuclear pore membrane glycoprotein 210 [Eumeta japonica]
MTINEGYESAKINSPRVLLPWFENLPVNFTFEITEGGCYSWTLSRDDIIDIEPFYEETWGHCSRSARVSVSRTCIPPGWVILLAEEIQTGEVLRVDVEVDKIRSLKVTSTTLKLYLEEAPEAFEVVAYDEQGNTFSTLEGVAFNWTIKNQESNINQDPLVTLVRWSDTDYEAPRGIAELEAHDLHSYSVLLYGHAMGEVQVSVCLGKICTDFVLNVVASVVLIPGTAVIASEWFELGPGRLTIQDVMDTVYYLNLPDNKIAYLEDSVSLVRGKTVGSTSISLMSGASEVTTASLRVAEPHSIRVHFRPSNLLVRDEIFVIHCIVLDAKGHALTAGEETLIRLSVDGEANVDLLYSTENGTLTNAIAHKSGTFIVVAKLHSVGGKSPYQKVEGQASAMVVDPLEVVPPELYVAWTDTIQEVTLKYRGGGKEPVLWSEIEGDEQTDFVLAPDGNLIIRGVGELTFKVQLLNHPHVYAYGRVLSASPESIRASTTGQAKISQPHYLHVAVTATHPSTGELFNFHRCNCGTFSVAVLDGPEARNITSASWIQPEDGACCTLQAVWEERGVSSLRISRGRAGDTVRVAVRAAPQLLWPANAAALVSATLPVIGVGEALFPFSTDSRIADLVLRDGPPPFRYPDAQLFTLKCNRKGETRLELRSEIHKERESVEFAVACAPNVHKIQLEPSDVQGNCSGGSRVWLRPQREVKIKVILFDSIGRELLDERGPRVAWETSPSNPGLEYKYPDRLFVESHPDFEPVPVPYKYYQVVIADEQAIGWSGSLKASIPQANAVIQAKVVSPLHIDVVRVYIAFEGDSVANIATVTGGSGRYGVDAPKGVSALVEGGLLNAIVPGPGSYDLIVTDTCIADEKQYIEVNIEEVLNLEVVTSRAVGVGACVPISALVKGPSHRYLTTSHPPEWRVSGNIAIREGKLCGQKEGTGKIRASFAGVWSSEVEILVFPPLTVSPQRTRLLNGARLQLLHSGGPPAHLATLRYEAIDGVHHVEVSPSGLVNALSLGNARIRLTARDIAEMEMASAEAEIEVVPISGITVKAATSTLLVGCPGPLWLEAAGALGPSVLAGLQPPPRVTWSARDSTTARLYATHRDDLLERSVAEGLSVRVVPLKPGSITIDVRVRNMGQLDIRSWESTVEILAISDIQASVDGAPQDLKQGDRLAVAVGSTIRLKSTPRAIWRSYVEDGAFEITSSGEFKALKPGYGVVIAQHKDERNHIYRETVSHVEVSVPHYCTVEPAGDEHEVALRVVMRNAVGRALLAPDAVLTAQPPLAMHVRRSPHSVLGNELVMTGLEPEGALMSISGAIGGTTLHDHVWVAGTDVQADRVVVSGGWVVCVPGVGWRAPPAVSLYEASGITLAVFTQDVVTRHILKADRPPRSFIIHQLPINKIEFLPGEWPPSMVPLSIESSGLTGGPLLCDEEQRNELVGLDVQLPFTCRAQHPHVAAPALDMDNGHMGCSVSTVETPKDSSELEVCAEWGGGRTCTKVLLLPPIQVDQTRVTLGESPAIFTVQGHPHALKLVKITSSPGLKLDIAKKEAEWQVTVRSEGPSCNGGLVTVTSRLTAQQFRVEVEGECDKACGSLLGVLLSLLLPRLHAIVAAGLAVTLAVYIHNRFGQKSSINTVKPLVNESVIRPTPPASGSPWSRSPRTPLTPRSPFIPRSPDTTAPVYGDASILPDRSFSPTSTQTPSRFL